MKTNKPKNQAHKHPAAIALDVWLEEHGDASLDPTTLGQDNPSYYLANRISRAFIDGWHAAENHYCPKAELKGLKL
jgi:hypothetical protein